MADTEHPEPAVTRELPNPPAVTLELPRGSPTVPPSPDKTVNGEPRIERLGRFEIVGFLGEGGFGKVYEAHDPRLDRRVALKVARRERLASERSAVLFLQEARAAANLRHPHIVAVFDSGKDGFHYFIASAFIEGKSLDKRLAELAGGQTLPFRESAAIVRQLAEALAYAHGRGVVHRDVKPANIMIDERGQPLLMDFGLAARRREGDSQGQEHPALGTPEYMAPEQIGGNAEAASDQYSLGCTLYELLTGHTPFSGPAEIQLFLHQNEPPSRLRKVNTHVPLDLEAICLRCLSKKPSARYADCQELADDLRRWLDREPVRARRMGFGERSWRWAQRKPFQAAFALSSVLLVALLLFAGWREARDYRLKYERQLRAEAYRSDREADYLAARQLMAEGKWSDARTRLVGIQKGLEALADESADVLSAQVKESLASVDQQIQTEQDRTQATARRQAFEKPYREAVFRQVPLTGHNQPENRAAVQAAARQALAVYGLDVDAASPARLIDGLEHDRPLLTPTDFSRLVGACYELLVIWADVEAANQRDRNKAEQRQQGERALALLERAGRLGQAYGVQTRTYYLRKARYWTLGRAEDGVVPLIEPDAPRQPTGSLDWFLTGLESYHQAEQTDESGKAEKYLEASKALGMAIQGQADHFWAHYLLGLCQLRLGRWRESTAAFTSCMNLQPGFPWPLVMRGFAASEQGAWYREQEQFAQRKALQQGKRLLQGDDTRRFRREKEFEFALARADFDQVLGRKGLDAEARYVALVNRGVLAIYEEQWPAAIADLEAAVRMKKAAFQGHLNLAQALHGAGQDKEALAAVGRAIACAPDRPELYVVRARMHLARKNRLAARADFERAIAREPKIGRSRRRAETLVTYGQLLLEEEDYSAALTQFERALASWPDLVLTERFRAEALLRLKRSDEAAAALDHYLAATPEPVPEALQARGILYAGKGQLGKSIELYSAALRLNDKDTKTRGYRGWAHIEIGSNRLALEDFEMCLSERPQNVDYLTGHAVACVRLRKIPEALVHAEAAEKKGHLTDRLCYHLSCVYAQAAAQKALEAGTGHKRQVEQAVARYEEKAILLLTRALADRPEWDRPRFWREVDKEPALSAIRGGRLYSQLARKYGGDRGDR